jgi:ribosomal RNA-processing protein 1
LTYHIADIFLEELDKALEDPPLSEGEPYPPAPVDVLVRPFFSVACRNPSKITFQHIRSAVLDPLFADLSTAACLPLSPLDDNDVLQPPPHKRLRREADYPHLCAQSIVRGDAPEEESSQPDIVRKQLADVLLQMASAPDTRDANRRKLYAFWKEIGGDEDEG